MQATRLSEEARPRSRRLYWFLTLCIFVLPVSVILFFGLVVPKLWPSRATLVRRLDDGVAVMRKYCAAQEAYKKTDWNGDGKLAYATSLAELYSRTKMIPEGMMRAHGRNGTPYKGYLFLECKTMAAKKINWKHDYALCAIPATYGKTAVISLIVNTNGTVFAADLGPKGTFDEDYPEDPALDEDWSWTEEWES